MPLSKSKLITRKQLACLTGGKIGNFHNPLRVGTPMNFCGGRSLAMSQGQIHHICIKEGRNEIPSSSKDSFVLKIYQKTYGEIPSEANILVEKWKEHPSMPIFWEPFGQSGLSDRVKGKGVTYVGHWKVTGVETYADQPVFYLGFLRCATIVLKFDRLDEKWIKIIADCRDRTVEEISSMNEENYWGREDQQQHSQAATVSVRQSCSPMVSKLDGVEKDAIVAPDPVGKVGPQTLTLKGRRPIHVGMPKDLACRVPLESTDKLNGKRDEDEKEERSVAGEVAFEGDSINDTCGRVVGNFRSDPNENVINDCGLRDLVVDLSYSRYLKIIKKIVKETKCMDDANAIADEIISKTKLAGGRFLDRVKLDGKYFFLDKQYSWARNKIVEHLQHLWKVNNVNAAKKRKTNSGVGVCAGESSNQCSPQPILHTSLDRTNSEPIGHDHSISREIAEDERSQPSIPLKRVTARRRKFMKSRDEIESSKKLNPIEKMGQYIAVLLKDFGWTQKLRSIHGLDQYIHYKPGTDIKTAVEGRDKFTGFEKLALWAYDTGFYEKVIVRSDRGQDILECMGITKSPFSIFESATQKKRNYVNISQATKWNTYRPKIAGVHDATGRLNCIGFHKISMPSNQNQSTMRESGQLEGTPQRNLAAFNSDTCQIPLGEDIPMTGLLLNDDNQTTPGGIAQMHQAGSEVVRQPPPPFIHEQNYRAIFSGRSAVPRTTPGRADLSDSCEADQFMEVFDEAEHHHFIAEESNDEDSKSFYGYLLQWLTKKADDDILSLGESKSVVQSLMKRFAHRKKRMEEAGVKFGGTTSAVHQKHIDHLIKECKASLG